MINFFSWIGSRPVTSAQLDGNILRRKMGEKWTRNVLSKEELEKVMAQIGDEKVVRLRPGQQINDSLIVPLD